MGALLQVGLAVLVQAVAEEFGSPSHARPELWIAFACLPHLFAWAARRALLAGRFRLGARMAALQSTSPLILFALAVHAFGWPTWLERELGQGVSLLDWPTPAALLCLAPFAVYAALSVDARLRFLTPRRVSDEEGDEVRVHAYRAWVAALIPVVVYVLVAWAVGSASALRLRVETVSLWNAVYAGALLALFAAGVPNLIRAAWRTERLPDGVERSVLEGVAKLAGFRCRELYLWRTANGVANAAILGLFPRQRVVLFTDLLLAELDLRQLASVFAHEIGHAKRHHVAIFATWSFAALFAADLLAERWASDQVGAAAATLAAAMVVWAFVFGWMSRRFELQADLFSLRLVGDPAPLIAALESVSGAHGRRRTSWRHFSTERRVGFLQAAARDPAVGEGLERRLRRVTWLGVAAFVAVMAVQCVDLARAWPREQVVLALREGDYRDAARRAERLHPPDKALNGLVARAGELPLPARDDLDDIRGRARASLDDRSWQAASDWLELGALRGDVEMAQVSSTLSAALEAPKTDLADLQAGLPDAWRAALEPLFAELRRSPP